ncbi:MAG: cytochrome c-type biogenesis protein [Alphaproteobacteria bacterium]
MRALVLALALILAGVIAGLAPVWAVMPDEILDDPVLEVRARDLSREIRCLVCQNQDIDSSNADLARDLRILVRERLVAGDSDADVKAYLVARYGDFVLFNPPVKPATYLLWFGPVLIVLLGAGGIFVHFARRRRNPAIPAAPLSAAERQRLERLLADTKTAESDPR